VEDWWQGGGVGCGVCVWGGGGEGVGVGGAVGGGGAQHRPRGARVGRSSTSALCTRFTLVIEIWNLFLKNLKLN